MGISMRQIGDIMDECPSPKKQGISLNELAKAHSWPGSKINVKEPVYPMPLSLSSICKRHEDPEKKVIKFLWYNTYLMPGFNLTDAFPSPFKNILPSIEIKSGPAREVRSKEIGNAVKESSYDVAAFCEVFEDSTKSSILAAWNPLPYYAQGPAGKEIELARGFLERMGKEIGGISGAFMNALDSMINVAEDIANTLTFGLFGEAEKAALPTITIASSGLLTISTGRYPIISSNKREFNEQGNIFRDADAWSNKGVLQVVIDTGFRNKIELYSTHLMYGGDFLSLSPPERLSVQKIQMDNLIEFVNQTHNPENYIVVAGDFNINASTAEAYDSLSRHMTEGLGLQDVWTRYAEACYGAKVGGTNSTSSFQTCGGKCNGVFCDDHTQDILCEEGRIDYVFIQNTLPLNSEILIDISRPRRRHFKRDSSWEDYGDIQFMSDHLALEMKFIISKYVQPVGGNSNTEHKPANPTIG